MLRGSYDQKSIDDHITSLNLGTSDHINYEAELVSQESVWNLLINKSTPIQTIGVFIINTPKINLLN